MPDPMKSKGVTGSSTHLRARPRKPPRPVLVSSVQSGEVADGADRGSATSGAEAVVTGLRSVAKGASDRILLAEDNQVNQRITVAMLESLGYCVDVVEDGVEAVTAAALVPYRAILMDCQIPVLNGFEATVEIRSHEGASRDSPIIAVTSAATEADHRHCLDVGMNGLVSKPVSLESLATGWASFAPDHSLSTGPQEPETPQPTTTTGRPLTSSSRPALDPDVLDRLEALGAAAGEDLVGDVTTLFLLDADTRMLSLHDALAREDGPALILSAHTMCGASANLGATDLSRLCARLATDGTAGDFESGHSLLQSVEAELSRVRSALVSTRPSLFPDEQPRSTGFLPDPIAPTTVPVPAVTA